MNQNRPRPTARKRKRWTTEEDRYLTKLYRRGMLWGEIAKYFPGRTYLACRLRYRNYLERSIKWDEGRKNELAIRYKRLKSGMWTALAQKLHISWQEVEAMHWAIGAAGMTQKARAITFQLVCPVNMKFDQKPLRTSHQFSKMHFIKFYNSLKPYIWAKLAAEMDIPWQAAEAMHWGLGEADMARRASVFPLTIVSPIGGTSPGTIQMSTPLYTSSTEMSNWKMELFRDLKLKPELAQIKMQSTGPTHESLPGIAAVIKKSF